MGDAVAADALALLGDACRRAGDLDAADAALSTAVHTARDPGVLADALRHSSRVALERADPARERALLDEALRVTDRADVTRHAKVLAGLAWWELRNGDLDACVGLAEQALDAAERVGSIGDQIDIWSRLAEVATLKDDYDDALSHARTCLELARVAATWPPKPSRTPTSP